MTLLSDSYDVAVVGARCAGSPLATLLARGGVRVALLDRASFPSDTLSSHLFEADGLAFLNRLGVADQIRATGAPMVEHTDTRIEDVRLQIRLPQRDGDIGAIASVRRTLLDQILCQAAEQAGAELQTSARVTGLIRDNARVAGLRYIADGRERELRARLVVGADGRHSMVARLCSARRYNATPSRRMLFWAFFEDAQHGPVPTFLSHRFADRFILGIPSDSGLYQALIWPERHERGGFREDLPGAFLAHARSCEPLANILDGARQVGKVRGAVAWEGFFREAAGPGWVLLGDAGHFKSPAPGRGIADAFLQADKLAEALIGSINNGDRQLDATMSRWGRWRDREFAEHYWLAADLEDPGRVPALLVEVVRGLQRQNKAQLFFDILNHRIRPSRVLTPPRVAGALGRLIVHGDGARASVLKELGELGVREVRRRWQNRHLSFHDEIADEQAPDPEPDKLSGPGLTS